MKIFITTPDYSLHGGIRIILEWANRLSVWHQVHLFSLKGGQCNWFAISPDVIRVNNTDTLAGCDCLIITSPHSAHLAKHEYPKKKFVFMQMCEHLFRPNDLAWKIMCRKFYTVPFPLISISRWNIENIKAEFGRTGPIHYVGNGVNLQHFPISRTPKDGSTILVEGWESNNPSKDPARIGPKVAYKLKQMGYKILAYSQKPLNTYTGVPDEYYQVPSLEKMNELYERATILIKASKYDARSCAPMEAMTKGTVTARAIYEGDDDLINLHNCYRTTYNEKNLYEAALSLLKNEHRRKEMADNCIRYVEQYSWEHWMDKINHILCNA